MVTSAELDLIRADVLSQILDHKCDIERDVGTTNADGHPIVNWQPHLENVPCHMAVITGEEITGSMVNIEQLVDFINMPFDTDVTNNDRITQIRNQKGEVISGPLLITSAVTRATHLLVFAKSTGG